MLPLTFLLDKFGIHSNRKNLYTITFGKHTLGMQHSVQYGSQAYGLGLDEKLFSQYLNEKGYVSHTVGKVMTNLKCSSK